jgi:hypothetical protein
MKHVAWMSGLAVAMASAMAPAHALPSIAVGGAAGSQGLGGQLTFELIPWINLRAALQGLGLSHDFTKDNTDYNGKLHLFSYGAMFDIYPLTRGPRLTVGLFGNRNKVDINADCSTNTCEANDLIIQGGNAAFNGNIKFATAAPYAGLGWGNAMAGLPFYFSTDIGVMLQGSPKVSLNASGTATVTDKNTGISTPNVNVGTDPTVQSQLSTEQENLASQLHSYRYYPVAMLSLGWRF